MFANMASGDWWGFAAVAIALAFIAFVNIRNMRTATGNLAVVSKRGMMWTAFAIILFAQQMMSGTGDPRFLVILGLVTLFAGSQWLGAAYYASRRNRE